MSRIRVGSSGEPPKDDTVISNEVLKEKREQKRLKTQLGQAEATLGIAPPNLAERPPPEEYLCMAPFPLVQGRNHGLFAAGGSGKSIMALYASMEVITRGGRVLYFMPESTEREQWERITSIRRGLGLTATQVINGLHTSFDSFGFRDEGAMDLFKQVVQANRYDLVIFDTWMRFHQGSENENHLVVESTDALDEALADPDNPGRRLSATLILSHVSKSEIRADDPCEILGRGGSSLRDHMDFTFGLIGDDRSKSDAIRKVGLDKHRGAYVTERRLDFRVSMVAYDGDDDYPVKTVMTYDNDGAREAMLELDGNPEIVIPARMMEVEQVHPSDLPTIDSPQASAQPVTTGKSDMERQVDKVVQARKDVLTLYAHLAHREADEDGVIDMEFTALDLMAAIRPAVDPATNRFKKQAQRNKTQLTEFGAIVETEPQNGRYPARYGLEPDFLTAAQAWKTENEE